MADIKTNEHFANVVLSINDKDKNPAPVDGVPIWASSDETVLRAVPNADGMSGTVEAVGPGTARITISADADMGDGVATITGVSEDVNVTLGIGPASIMTLDLGPSTPKV